MDGILNQITYYYNKDKYKNTIIDLEDHINNHSNYFRVDDWFCSFTEDFFSNF